MRKILKVLFSRYVLSAILILLEVALLTYIVVEMSAYSGLFLLFAMTIDFLVLIAIINADCNPEYRVTWTAIVLMIPVFGAILYILFRHRVMSKKEQRLMRGIISELDKYEDDSEAVEALGIDDPLAAGKALGILGADPTAKLYRGQESHYFSSGEDMYAAMLDELKRAEKFIFLEYFIIDEGEMWQGMLDILTEKAACGVEVRVMYDDIGCMRTLPAHYDRTLAKQGIRAVCFSRVNPRVTAVHNNRDHRKICVVDGRVAFTGGINIADEYINVKERFGYWKDGGVSIYGAAVTGFTKLFLTLWDMNEDTMSDYAAFLECEECKEKVTDTCDAYYIPFGSGPQPVYTRQVGKRAFLDIINQAQRYVYITTPYLIVDFDLTEALCGAAERGVDVRIITPGKADKKLVKVMTKSSYPYLMKSGVKIYEYTPGFMHTKSVVSDDLYAVVGTINFDYRSLVHHFENALWMYRASTVLSVRDDFLTTLEACHLMNEEEAKLGPVETAVKCGLRLFAPLL